MSVVKLNLSKDSDQPLLVICFGVSGCGKSTLAEHLAEKFALEYIEADDFHPQVNKDHMAAGNPLDDAMREPWIVALCEHIKTLAGDNQSSVMANSCLKKKYRDRYRDLGCKTLFIHLHGDRDLIYSRMQARSEHFMPPELLDSQFATLESTAGESDVITINIAQTIPEIIAEAEGLFSQ